jgi:ribosome biogenesis GTPase
MIGIDHLKELIKDKINVIAGHSGAGKSSIINALDPTLNQKTGEISDYHQQGNHITTFSEMLPFSFGGYVIDTPGIRGFGLIDLQKKEISHFFREIFLAGSDCKYYNCTTTCEPECNVVREVQAGKIALSRYLSYLNILENDDNRYRSS